MAQAPLHTVLMQRPSLDFRELVISNLVETQKRDSEWWLFVTAGKQLVDVGGVLIKGSCCPPPPLETLSSPIRTWWVDRKKSQTGCCTGDLKQKK